MAKTTIQKDSRKDAVYARQSLDKKDSLSIETQIDKGKEYSGEEVEIYQDRGYSGKNIERPDLKRLKADIEANRIKRVIVYRLDRISRNITDFYQMYQLMETHKVEFVSLREQFETSSPMGRAMMGILIVFAQMERESIQERVKDNYYYRIAGDGRWPGGPAPRGFDIARTEDNKPTLKQNADIEMVKMAFEKYAYDANTSLAKIGKELSAEGYKSNRANGAFDNCTIARMLQNPIYAIADNLLYKYFKTRSAHILNDEASWDGSTSAHIVGKKTGNSNTRKYTSLEEQTVYKTNFSGVVSSATYIAVQERLAKNEQIRRANAPSKMKELAGLVKCAKCGYAIKIYDASNLRCYARSALHRCDASIKIKFPELQQKVAADIQGQLDDIAVKILENSINRQNADNRIAELEEKIDQLLGFVEEKQMSHDLVAKRIKKLEDEINKIALSQQRNLSFADAARISESLPFIYNRLNDDEKKSVAQILIERVLLSEDGTTDVKWKI